jgi:hypothetical protein
MLLLHQVVPHLHHQHENDHHHDVTHSHHDNHHQKAPEKENSKGNLFEWILESHTHSTTSTDVLVLKKPTIKKITFEKEVVIKVLPLNTINIIKGSTLSKKWFFKPPDKLHGTYLLNLSLRGPPTLV